MRKATIKDICDGTGLSLGTVSKYLNGGRVKETNKKKIDEVIKSLNYRVDEYARGLITNRTKTVGILISRLDNLFYSRIISEIASRLYTCGYVAIIRESNYEVQKEIESIEWFISRRVDALIVMPVGSTREDYAILDSVNIPVIFLNSEIEGVCCESIVTNNEEISYRAVEYLLDKGHRKIAIIIDENNPYTAQKRLNGYKRAFFERGLGEELYRIYTVGESIDFAYSVAKKIITETDATAVFASNYISTVGVTYLLNELSLPVPQRISVLGFDDIMITNLFRPKLTIVNQPTMEIASFAVQRLLELLSAETFNYKVSVLKNNLVIGESVADIRSN